MKQRIATERDAAALAELRWDFRTEELDTTSGFDKAAFLSACAEFLRHHIASRQWICFLVEDDDVVVANVFMQRVRKIPKPERLIDEYGYITNVYTRPAHRGNGIGTKLLRETVLWAKEHDLDTLVVWPSVEGVEFYRRLGFKTQNDIMEYDLRCE